MIIEGPFDNFFIDSIENKGTKIEFYIYKVLNFTKDSGLFDKIIEENKSISLEL